MSEYPGAGGGDLPPARPKRPSPGRSDAGVVGEASFCGRIPAVMSTDSTRDETLEAVRSWIRDAERIAVLTGAGISTESGIPDFRGPKGVWTRNPDAEKMATLQHYVADPEVRKRAWRNRLESAAWTAEPNAGHHALVDLERGGRLLALLTQNVDGLRGRPRSG